MELNEWFIECCFLIAMIVTLMVSAKVPGLGLLKIKIFWNIGYDVINFVHDVTKIFYLVNQIIM